MPRKGLLVDPLDAPRIQACMTCIIDAQATQQGLGIMCQTRRQLLFHEEADRDTDRQPQQPDHQCQAGDQPQSKAGAQRSHTGLPNT